MRKHSFRDAPFLTAREKELTLKAWVRFLKRGLQFGDFSKRLYDHLHLHCQFIAHYDRAGFYRTYFEEGEDTLRFLSQFDGSGECRSVEYGSVFWRTGEYGDIAEAMIEEAAPHIPKLREAALAKAQEADLGEAKRLLAKHGYEFPS